MCTIVEVVIERQKRRKQLDLEITLKKTVFGFPDDKDISRRWRIFANRFEDPCSAGLSDLGESSKREPETSGICIDHFEEKYIKRGEKRVDLISIPRKAPTKRKYDHPLLDQTEKFIEFDKISYFEDLKDSYTATRCITTIFILP